MRPRNRPLTRREVLKDGIRRKLQQARHDDPAVFRPPLLPSAGTRLILAAVDRLSLLRRDLLSDLCGSTYLVPSADGASAPETGPTSLEILVQ